MTTPLLERGASSTNPEKDESDLALERLEQRLNIGVPDDISSIADKEAEVETNKNKTIEQLEQELGTDRALLAQLGAKRGNRLFSRGNSLNTQIYETHHGAYNEKVIQLGKLKLAEELKGLTPEEKNVKAIEYLFDEQRTLREQTIDNMQNTPMGKVVGWMNKGGRLKKFMKYAFVGGVAAGIGVATGGLGGGAIAVGAVGAVGRFGRGFIQGEGKNGRTLKDIDDGHLDELKAEYGDNHEALIEAGADAFMDTFNKDVTGRQKDVRKSFGRGALYAGLGMGIGAAVHYGAGLASGSPDQAQTSGGTKSGEHQMLRPTADTKAGEHQMLDQAGDSKAGEHIMLASGVHEFAYNPAENPFYAPGKLGVHDLGTPLQADAIADGGRPAGFNDLVNNRWTNSPEQFASIYSAMNSHGLPDNMTAANALGEEFKVNPVAMQTAHSEVMTILNDPSTTISQHEIHNPYSSEYGVDMGNGNMDLAWDDHVDQGGTKTVIEYTDPATGARKVLELRNECGGQRIVEMQPAPVVETYEQPGVGNGYIPASYEQPQPYYEQPGTGNGPELPPEEQPPTTTPPPTGPPPTGPPPVAPPPPVVVPPEVNTPKGDHWIAPGMDDTTDSGVGTKPVVPEVTEPAAPAPPVEQTSGGESSSTRPGTGNTTPIPGATAVEAGAGPADQGEASTQTN